MTRQSDDGPGANLPRWLRRAFWCVVVLEWVAAAGLCSAFVVGGYWVARYLSCADAVMLYAPGYSESAWLAVREGDTQADVRVRLGEPLQLWSGEEGDLWSYSRPATRGDDYLERKLRFDGQRRLLEKHDECYLD